LCSLLVSHYYGRGPNDDGDLLPLSSGAPNGRGPGFIEPAELAIATPLITAMLS